MTDEWNSWRNWGDAWPDWRDAGKRVCLRLESGALVDGKLFVDDFYPDGEGDEYPVWAIKTDDGTVVDFADHEAWRFCKTAGKAE